MRNIQFCDLKHPLTIGSVIEVNIHQKRAMIINDVHYNITSNYWVYDCEDLEQKGNELIPNGVTRYYNSEWRTATKILYECPKNEDEKIKEKVEMKSENVCYTEIEVKPDEFFEKLYNESSDMKDDALPFIKEDMYKTNNTVGIYGRKFTYDYKIVDSEHGKRVEYVPSQNSCIQKKYVCYEYKNIGLLIDKLPLFKKIEQMKRVCLNDDNRDFRLGDEVYFNAGTTSIKKSVINDMTDNFSLKDKKMIAENYIKNKIEIGKGTIIGMDMKNDGVGYVILDENDNKKITRHVYKVVLGCEAKDIMVSKIMEKLFN